MTRINRVLLWMLGTLIPIMIAACYGPMYRYTRYGQVIDDKTQEGVTGIKVTCLRDGGSTSTTTHGDGTFYFDEYERCEALNIEDVDGQQNGGTYHTRTVPASRDGETVVRLEH